MALPKTRLDKLVQIRERSEDSALAHLADAQAVLGKARERLAGAVELAGADHRTPGEAALWVTEEAAHVRALQAVRMARGLVSAAAVGQQAAQVGYVAARQKAEAARRVVGRKHAEMKRLHERAERRQLDEIGATRFCRGR
jgi:flagellar protein FliJ